MNHELMTATRRRSHWLTLAVVGAVAAFVSFYRLGDSAVYWWDEARVALNSLEMTHSTNPLIVTFNGQADLWNTKPPLAIWLNALSLRLFGVNEFALRLPSAIAAICTTLVVFRFTHRISDTRTAFLAAVILLGIGGYIDVHVARTADYDSLLVLFTTLTAFSLFFAFDSKRFYASAAYAFCSFLAKGIAGLMMAPGSLLYAIIYRKDLRPAILPGVAVFAGAALYLVARELAETGYLRAVWLQDVMRFNAPAEKGNGRDTFFYVLQLVWPWQASFLNPQWNAAYVGSAFPWSWIALLSLRRPSKAVGYLWCCIGTHVLIVSAAATQHPWYVASAYPLIAVLAALGIMQVQETLDQRWIFSSFVVLAILCVGLDLHKIDRELEGVMIWRERGQASLIHNLPQSARVRVRPDVVWRTPAVRDGKIVGTELYFGAIEFYRRQRPAGAVEIECAAVPFVHDTGRAVPTSCYPPNVRPTGPVIHLVPDSQFVANP